MEFFFGSARLGGAHPAAAAAARSRGRCVRAHHRIMSRCPLTNHHSARFMHTNSPVNHSQEMIYLFEVSSDLDNYIFRRSVCWSLSQINTRTCRFVFLEVLNQIFAITDKVFGCQIDLCLFLHASSCNNLMTQRVFLSVFLAMSVAKLFSLSS